MWLLTSDCSSVEALAPLQAKSYAHKCYSYTESPFRYPQKSVPVRLGQFRYPLKSVSVSRKSVSVSTKVRFGPFRSVSVRSGPFRSVPVSRDTRRNAIIRSGWLENRSLHILSALPGTEVCICFLYFCLF